MKWLLLIVIIFSLLTVFFLHKVYRKNQFPKKAYIIITAMETAAAIISIALFFCI